MFIVFGFSSSASSTIKLHSILRPKPDPPYNLAPCALCCRVCLLCLPEAIFIPSRTLCSWKTRLADHLHCTKVGLVALLKSQKAGFLWLLFSLLIAPFSENVTTVYCYYYYFLLLSFSMQYGICNLLLL